MGFLIIFDFVLYLVIPAGIGLFISLILFAFTKERLKQGLRGRVAIIVFIVSTILFVYLSEFLFGAGQYVQYFLLPH